MCKSHRELQAFIDEVRPITRSGKVAEYIPALKMANADDLSIAVLDLSGNCYYAGHYNQTFTLQSISKILTLAYCLCDLGYKEVFKKVGMEPTGDPFNSIVKLELLETKKPLNPMINAGALAVTSLLVGDNKERKWERFLHFMKRMTNNEELTYNEEVARSEYETAYLNRAFCYFLKEHQLFDGNVEELLELYTRQCAIEVNCLDLARIGAIFANDGIDPMNHKSIIPIDIARICKTFMVTCGMYNASGEFAIKVGIPAKSGVSGGILGVVPKRYGIGVYGPSLDEKGNSLGGWKLLELMNKKYDLSIF